MALSGLQIQKLLPKTNCKECGSNTCLAFAMKLAAKKAELSECPYASEEAKQILGAASEPPVKSVTLGKDESLRLGEETVLYRHEKTFVNKTLIAININDNDSKDKIEATLKQIKEYSINRVGEDFHIDLICVTDLSGNPDTFASAVKHAFETTGKPVIMKSSSTAALAKAAAEIKRSKGIIASANTSNQSELVKIAADNGHALVVTAVHTDELVALTEKLKAEDFNNIVLNFKAESLAERFQLNSIARRMAIKNNYKPLGYAFIHFIEDADVIESTIQAINEISKYGGIIVLPVFDAAQLTALITLRLNIFTDPQKPIQVDPKIYPIGEPNSKSPVFLTTNFSLTYFIVSGEIENSGVSAWLVIPQCEGMSVLTAWAAGKFSGAYIAKFIKEIELEKQIETRDIIIPGYVAQISGELEENLPGWKVMVGPQEAADIESFVKARILNK